MKRTVLILPGIGRFAWDSVNSQLQFLLPSKRSPYKVWQLSPTENTLQGATTTAIRMAASIQWRNVATVLNSSK